ncbi:hypothetical protein Q31b_20580 [Novipirellula aureliae]|uniref:Uncharacterized protein n=1 Tax=Novipirellula aureliae TaxID=2527966 RepID=A0A5C6E014_9BACT|nr:hypothetical protein Q31b_20580 [Novipirellula aureliae]
MRNNVTVASSPSSAAGKPQPQKNVTRKLYFDKALAKKLSKNMRLGKGRKHQEKIFRNFLFTHKFF